MVRKQEEIEVINKIDRNKAIKRINTSANREKKRIEENRLQELASINEEYGAIPKERANYDELVILIRMVLVDGITGTIAIRKYAELESKTKQWIDEVAKPQVGKNFKRALDTLEDHPVITSIKKNESYDKKDILNKSVTGALTKLSKQVKTSNLIDDLRNEVDRLKEQLVARIKGEDWKPEALRLYQEGNSYRIIEEKMGISKSKIAKYLKGK